MQKIPTLLVRNPDNRSKVLDEVTPGCEWVLAGEGVATQKFDGTCVMFDDEGKWWARREVGKNKQAPENYIAEHFDSVTGKTQGWEPIEQSPFAKFHAEALTKPIYRKGYTAGTYELCGPKINGNPENLAMHEIIKHGSYKLKFDDESSIARIKNNVLGLVEYNIEGLVWHNPDGRMAKLKTRDLT